MKQTHIDQNEVLSSGNESELKKLLIIKKNVEVYFGPVYKEHKKSSSNVCITSNCTPSLKGEN